MTTNASIKKFYETDGQQYGHRRWHQYPTGRFDYRATERAIRKNLVGQTIGHAVEIGCGPGTWTGLLDDHAEQVTAIDISETMLAQAKKTHQERKIVFVRSDIMDYEPESSVDFIFSIRAFEYFKDKNTFLSQASSWLKPGGRFLIITKTKGSWWYGRSRIRNVLKRILPFLFYIEKRESNRQTENNLQNFWQERLLVGDFKRMLKNHGFEDIRVRPVIIRPPIFMRGKTEIPLIPPIFERAVLLFFEILDRLLSRLPGCTIFAESYIVTGKKP